jgi:hypothetical protein
LRTVVVSIRQYPLIEEEGDVNEDATVTFAPRRPPSAASPSQKPPETVAGDHRHRAAAIFLFR